MNSLTYFSLASLLAVLPASAHLKGGTLKPAGGETFEVGATMTIEWVAEQAHDGRYDIYVSKDGGATFPTEIAGPWQGSKTDGAKNIYLWKIPEGWTTTQGRVRICQLFGGHCVQPGTYMMDSPANFTVTVAATALQPQNQAQAGETRLDFLAQNGKLDIRFNLIEAQKITLKAFDVAGNCVATLAQGEWAKGEHLITALDKVGDTQGPLVFKLTLGDNRVISQLWSGF